MNSDRPPYLQVALLDPTHSPSRSSLQPVPFPSAPMASGTFTQGTLPVSPSFNGESSADIDMMNKIQHSLADLSLYPNAKNPHLDMAHLRIAQTKIEPHQPRAISSVCSHSTCPVVEAHAEGLYLFRGRKRHFENHVASCIARSVFGESNPPPSVWEGFDRLVQGLGTEADAVAEGDFQEAHFVDDGCGGVG